MTIDRPGAVREEDQPDLRALDAFLRRHIDGLEGPPTLAQFRGGASNLTYLLSYGTREIVVRTAPRGAKARSAHDMGREARVMAALAAPYPYVPAILATDEEGVAIGQPFYAMQAIRGIILRRDLPADLALDATGVQRLCENFVDRLVQLHAVDATTPALAALGKGEGYIARQVAGWTDRWQQALLPDTDRADDVTTWLRARQPARDHACCVIHNDFRFDNVVLDGNDPLSIIGVLDWELATLGDPLMDLGCSLAYWVQADDDPVFQSFRRQPTHVPGMLTRAEVVARYGERTGVEVGDFAFYEVFGLFRLMVIIQQIHRRFVQGHTHNPQFAEFGKAAAYMAGRCRRMIGQAG
jgi:aminoglycoside phosphotransferase (APT) family kinase protein